MGIRRTSLPFEGHYVQIPNAWMRDERLTRKARGLLAEIMTHRPGWRLSIRSLMRTGPEGRDAITTAVHELRDHGYLVVSQSHGEGGRFTEVEYELSDPGIPFGVLEDADDDGDSPVTGFPVAVDYPQGGADQPLPDNPHPKNTSSIEDQEKGDARIIDEEEIPEGSRVAVVLPKPFYLQTADWQWADEHTPSVKAEIVTAEFVAYWREGEGKGKRKKNWRLAWRNWMKREHQRNVERGWKPADAGAMTDRKVWRNGRAVG